MSMPRHRKTCLGGSQPPPTLQTLLEAWQLQLSSSRRLRTDKLETCQELLTEVATLAIQVQDVPVIAQRCVQAGFVLDAEGVEADEVVETSQLVQVVLSGRLLHARHLQEPVATQRGAKLLCKLALPCAGFLSLLLCSLQQASDPRLRRPFSLSHPQRRRRLLSLPRLGSLRDLRALVACSHTSVGPLRLHPGENHDLPLCC